jgi:hypothetical protein
MRDLDRDTRKLVHRAQHHIRQHNPIPLDLFADLMGAGIDVTELERTTRNENS